MKKVFIYIYDWVNLIKKKRKVNEVEQKLLYWHPVNKFYTLVYLCLILHLYFRNVFKKNNSYYFVLCCLLQIPFKFPSWSCQGISRVSEVRDENGIPHLYIAVDGYRFQHNLNNIFLFFCPSKMVDLLGLEITMYLKYFFFFLKDSSMCVHMYICRLLSK